MKKGDKFVLIVVIIVFLISFGSMAYYFLGKPSEGKVIAQIYKDDKLLYNIDLNNIDEPKEIKIDDKDGEFNTVAIEKGRIRFVDSNCRDKVCVKTAWLSKPGEMAVCIPHKTYIKIIGSHEEIDGTTF